MLRISSLALVGLILSLQAGSAATVAAFEATASARIRLVSALYADGSDASQALTKSAAFDEDDASDLSDGSRGNVRLDWHGDRLYDWMDAGAPAPGDDYENNFRISGSDNGRDLPYGETPSIYYAAYEYPALYYDPAFCDYDCDGPPIILTFDYEVSVSATASIAGEPKRSQAFASSSFLLSLGVEDWNHGEYSPDLSEGGTVTAEVDPRTGGPARRTASQSWSGTFSFLVRPDQSAYADFYLVDISGSAEVAPVPLPAASGLLAGALSLVPLARSRRNSRARRAG